MNVSKIANNINPVGDDSTAARCNSRLIPVADRCPAVGMAGCGHSKIARVLFVLYVLGTR